jgi:hypothetical protein
VIEVEPGLYVGSVEIYKELTIRGLGATPDEVTVHGDGVTSLRVFSGRVTVENLRIVHDSAPSDFGLTKADAGPSVMSAILVDTPERCDLLRIIVLSTYGAGIRVENGQCSISDCLIRSDGTSGVSVSRSARTTIQDVELVGRASVGIERGPLGGPAFFVRIGTDWVSDQVCLDGTSLRFSAQCLATSCSLLAARLEPEDAVHTAYPAYAFGPIDCHDSVGGLVEQLATETHQLPGWTARILEVARIADEAVDESLRTSQSDRTEIAGRVWNPVGLASRPSTLTRTQIRGFATGLAGAWRMSRVDIHDCDIGAHTNVVANARLHHNRIGILANIDGPPIGGSILRVRDTRCWANTEADIDVGVHVEELRLLGLRRPRLLRSSASAVLPPGILN